MGLDNYLVDRIFNLIDNGKGAANFDDFIRYLNVLMNGTKYEKAQWSFRMLAD